MTGGGKMRSCNIVGTGKTDIYEDKALYRKNGYGANSGKRLFLSKAFRALKKLPVFLCVGWLTYLILKYPTQAANGARDGLSLCAGVIIPTLFPFMVLCGFVVNSGMCERLDRLFSPVMNFLFRLPGSCACAVVMGLVGGYPSGLRTVSQLERLGYINKNEAFRLSLFCINAGPAFVIGTVGSAMLSSREAGAVLFAAVTLSSVTIGVLSRFLSGGKASPNDCRETFAKKDSAPTGLQSALISSVTESSGAMLSICSWTVLFASFCALLDCLPDALASFVVPLNFFLEVSSACREACAEGLALPVIAAILGWSGLSVIMQIFPYARQCGSRMSVLIASRFVNAALSALYCSKLCRLFQPELGSCAASTFANWAPWSSSAPASAGLMLMCALLILDCSGYMGGKKPTYTEHIFFSRKGKQK